jgi:RNA polymerase sigma-70 factor (ECF subfamily)
MGVGESAGPRRVVHVSAPDLALSSDIRLAKQAASGSSDALRSILTRITPRLRTVAWSIVRDHHEAEDLCQEALVKICQPAVLGSYRGDGPLDAYLRRVAVREMISRRRAREVQAWKGIVLAEELPEPGDGGAPAAPQLGPELRAAMDALPQRAREVVVLIVLGELSYEETSEATGLKLGTVRSTYHRARAQLADSLGAPRS